MMTRLWEPRLAAIQIPPGERYVTGEDGAITTVLGSPRAQLVHTPIKTAKRVVDREAEAANREALAGSVELF